MSWKSEPKLSRSPIPLLPDSLSIHYMPGTVLGARVNMTAPVLPRGCSAGGGSCGTSLMPVSQGLLPTDVVGRVSLRKMRSPVGGEENAPSRGGAGLGHK